ncbi:MAG: calcium-binding EGF-like domain-containing protein, partial [Flavobacteriales bacterium]
MKNRILQILGVAAVATIGMVSCTTDECKDVNCGDNGTCVEGDCVCDLGYEGTNCETLVNAAFVGSFNVNEACSQSTDTYAVTISATDATTLTISNIYDAGLIVNGTINADGGVSIASQPFGTGTISGSMTATGGVVTINFTIAVNGQSD